MRGAAHAPVARVARQLLGFFILGSSLFGLKQALGSADRLPTLVVHVPARASAEEVEQAIDEAVLVDRSLSRGGALLDPIVRDQVLRSMRVSTGVDDAESEQELLDRALSLGLHRADPLIRKRLAFQAEQVLRGRLHADEPAPGELEHYLSAHAERYRHPARVSFAHAFVSRSRHPDDLAAASARVGERLARDRPDARAVFGYSEPTILPLELARVTDAEVTSRFGPSFAKGLGAAPIGVWQGPLDSSYGQHFVFVQEREPARLGNLEELRSRLLADRERDQKVLLVARELRRLRTDYRVEVQRASAN
ncbi:MAG: peptidylprolyl isomerase [Myxococcales bacterium]